MLDVAVDDGIKVSLTGTSPAYLEHLFKYSHTNTKDAFTITVNLRVSQSPRVSTVYLQVWNVADGAWETIASNHRSLSGIDFSLIGRVNSNLEDYYDNLGVLNEIACRVYQHIVIS